MRLKIINRFFAALAMLAIASVAHAGVISLQWDTTVSTSLTPEVASGDVASFVINFHSNTNDLSNLTLSANSLIDYSFRVNSKNIFITLAANHATVLDSNVIPPLFSFNSLGDLTTVSPFVILTNLSSVSNPFSTSLHLEPYTIVQLYNDGYNCIVCIFPKDGTGHSIDVDNVELGLRAKSWKVKVDAPEPSTLAIFALGLIGLASRSLKKLS